MRKIKFKLSQINSSLPYKNPNVMQFFFAIARCSSDTTPICMKLAMELPDVSSVQVLPYAKREYQHYFYHTKDVCVCKMIYSIS